MAPTVFSIPIFFIVFRETLEAAIIVSVLLGLVEQIVHIRSDRLSGQTPSPSSPEENDKKENGFTSTRELAGDEDAVRTRRLVRKMRFQECPTLRIHHMFVTDATVQIFLGSALGFLIAAAIGATFIAIWFTKASDLYKKSEELWEGKPLCTMYCQRGMNSEA
jgi:high-affinity iron transporter